MGSAELVPGISGGTIAFITNIYRELIASLASFNFSSVKYLFKPRTFWELHNMRFLMPLGLGMLLAILSLANLFQYFISYYRPAVWAFFLGMMIVALRLIVRNVELKSYLAIFFMGVTLGFACLWLVPTESSGASPFLIFLGGVLAISAWILPGISGSYILLVLGLYPTIIGAIAAFEFSSLFVFSLGCIFGLIFFVRIVDWLYTNYADQFISFVVGFMVVSLLHLWPWQSETSDGSGFALDLLGPMQFEASTGQPANLIAVIVSGSLGFLSLWFFSKEK